MVSIFYLANNPLSCLALKNVQHVQQRVNLNLDVDGSGPLEPFPVTCEFYCKWMSINPIYNVRFWQVKQKVKVRFFIFLHILFNFILLDQSYKLKLLNHQSTYVIFITMHYPPFLFYGLKYVFMLLKVCNFINV